MLRLEQRSRPEMNRYERIPLAAGEAELRYLDGDYRIIRPGSYVRCAVTGEPIPLDELKYWSVEFRKPTPIPARCGPASA
jgi:hypothetical protein